MRCYFQLCKWTAFTHTHTQTHIGCFSSWTKSETKLVCGDSLSMRGGQINDWLTGWLTDGMTACEPTVYARRVYSYCVYRARHLRNKYCLIFKANAFPSNGIMNFSRQWRCHCHVNRNLCHSSDSLESMIAWQPCELVQPIVWTNTHWLQIVFHARFSIALNSH